MVFKSALIQPVILIIILIVFVSGGGFSIYKLKKNNQAISQKDIEIAQLKEQVEQMGRNRNNADNDKLSTAVEVIDLASLKGNKIYSLRCFRKSQGDTLNFQFLEQIDINDGELITICENISLSNFLIVTYSEAGRVTLGPNYGNFSFKEYSPKTGNLKEITNIQGGLYSWCDEIIALTKDNQLFVKCTGTIYKVPI